MGKILVLCEPAKDGAFSYVRSVIESFHHFHPDVQVDYYYSSRRSGPGLAELVESVKSRGGVAWDMKIGNFPELNDFKVLWKVIKAFRSGGYDAIHSNCSKAGAIVRSVNFLIRRKNVFYSPHAFYGMAGRGGVVEAVFNFIERFLRNSGKTIFSSDDEKNFAESRLGYRPNDGVILYNGIDTDYFCLQNPENRQESRAKLGIPQNAKVVLTIGRESYQKNLQSIYESLPYLCEQIPELFFIHLGAGGSELAKSLPAAVQKHVYNNDFSKDLKPYFLAADSFLMVSRYEGLSLSMLLALSTGITMILTQAPGMNLLKGFGFDGIQWIDAPDTPGYRNSLESVMVNWAANLPAPSGNQRELAQALFDEKKQFQKLVKLYGVLG